MMTEKIVNILFLGGISLFCFIKWLIITIKMKKYIKVCGKVISTEKWYSGNLRKGAHNKYSFEYNGKIYNIEDKFYGGNPKLKNGDKVYMYISKDNDSKYITPENLYFKNIYFIGFVIFMFALFAF